MDAKTEKAVKEAQERGKNPEGNEDHALRRKERIEFEERATAMEAELVGLEAQIERWPYMNVTQVCAVLADIARLQMRATRLVLEKKKRV